MMIIDKLVSDVRAKSPVCVGLDTQYGYLPDCLKQADLPLDEKIFRFNRDIIDSTRDLAGCYKLQIACYEAMGLAGMLAFARTLAYVRTGGSVAITDAKRGDISSTAKQYAQAHFNGDFETDMLTVNPYMGEDAISPFYDDVRRGKGLFVLVKTSNPGSGEFEDQRLNDRTLYELVASHTAKWGEPFIGESGFSSIGAVAGCTYPEQFQRIRAMMPHTFFLIPGYGAQGGGGKEIGAFFADGLCGVVNSSRGIICAHKGKSEDADFASYARQAALAMKEDIEQWL